MVDVLAPDLTTDNIKRLGDSYRGFLREMDSWDIVYRFDDFENDKTSVELVTRYAAVKTGDDGSIDASTTGISGEATIDVGDGATSGDNEYGGWPLSHLQFKGDLNAFIVARIHIGPAIVTSKMEFGFSDSLSHAGVVNDLAAVSATASDAAVWVYDTDDTATWQVFGVKGGGTPLKDESADIVAPVASTYQTLGVFLDGDTATFKQWDANGVRIGEDISIIDAIEGGTAICGWLFVQNRTGTLDRLVTIDYMAIGQRRF